VIKSNSYKVLVPCTFSDDLLDKTCQFIRENCKVYLFGLITQEMHGDPVKIEVTEIMELFQSLRLDEILKLIQGK
jgi:hypothetical protein